ncbi:putative short chain oxidoreductase [Protomyces lactucae-debilis]|uniref:Putative short chain oxidoreductase n=1 Tax=Protomyces lactucae-debilis TaxID=2754530 RepID=A0A1Y2FGH6_PROLT|nr:putative short chain oxidoreductase [Protomyces lactucae-debilis]ORY82514.1 putative short chain oxidoreductase [Protomyces lactucae-debilis]
MTITLITGANRGLGFETARRLKERGQKVYIGARNAAAGREAAEKLGVESVQLDVTNDESVNAAVKEIEAREGKLDILINNSGITGQMKTVEETSPKDLLECYETNVFGVVRMTKAFLPLLKKSDAPSVINISSGLGSFVMVQDTSAIESSFTNLPYNSSKSALNMITLQYARALPDVRFNIIDPGYTATDMNGHNGHQTVEEGTDAVVKMATTGKGGPTGTYTNRTGTVPW